MGIIIIFIYIWLGDKANQFCKRHILHLETVYVYNIGEWIYHRVFMGAALGWLTIPLAIIMWLFGVRG